MIGAFTFCPGSGVRLHSLNLSKSLPDLVPQNARAFRISSFNGMLTVNSPDFQLDHGCSGIFDRHYKYRLTPVYIYSSPANDHGVYFFGLCGEENSPLFEMFFYFYKVLVIWDFFIFLPPNLVLKALLILTL